jgi:hypothetical protein
MFTKSFKKSKKIRNQVTLPKSGLAIPSTSNPLGVKEYENQLHDIVKAVQRITLSDADLCNIFTQSKF